jgi:hypothetical protein
LAFDYNIIPSRDGMLIGATLRVDFHFSACHRKMIALDTNSMQSITILIELRCEELLMPQGSKEQGKTPKGGKYSFYYTFVCKG